MDIKSEKLVCCVSVLVTRERFFVGTMPAVVGMKTSLGVISKVTAKRVYFSNGNQWDSRTGISYTEAMKYGFNPTDEQREKIKYYREHYL